MASLVLAAFIAGVAGVLIGAIGVGGVSKSPGMTLQETGLCIYPVPAPSHTTPYLPIASAGHLGPPPHSRT